MHLAIVLFQLLLLINIVKGSIQTLVTTSIAILIEI